MLGANLRRLTDAARAHYGPEGAVALDMSELPEADWSRPVDDELLALAVVHAMHLTDP